MDETLTPELYMEDLSPEAVADLETYYGDDLSAITADPMVTGTIDPATAGIFAVFGIGFFLVMSVVAVVLIAALWKVFVKARQPGWAAIIPFYNVYVMLQVAGRPGWWLVLFLIPFVNIVVIFIMWIDIARAFGKGVGYGLGLAFLGIIFLPMLGFGSAEYVGQVSVPNSEPEPDSKPSSGDTNVDMDF